MDNYLRYARARSTLNWLSPGSSFLSPRRVATTCRRQSQLVNEFSHQPRGIPSKIAIIMQCMYNRDVFKPETCTPVIFRVREYFVSGVLSNENLTD